MPESARTRSTTQKLALFRQCFTGLNHVYGTYDLPTGCVRQVKEPVTDQVFLAHLQGKQPYGVYLLTGDLTRAVVADFDHHDANPALQLVHQAQHYGLHAYIERSKSKGWHAWIFLDPQGVCAAKARAVMRLLLDDIDIPNTEIFPKQDKLDSTTSYGNFINAPLFGKLVPQGRTAFVDPDRGMKPYPNQWALLESVQRVTEKQLDDIIEINELDSSTPKAKTKPVVTSKTNYDLPPCAMRLLREGVNANQRVTCFRLAIHLKKVGLPQEITAATLGAWSTKNRPQDTKRIITPDEIQEQTACAYDKDYRGYGCEDPIIKPYCDPTCPVCSHLKQPKTFPQCKGAKPCNR